MIARVRETVDSAFIAGVCAGKLENSYRQFKVAARAYFYRSEVSLNFGVPYTQSVVGWY